MIPTGGSAIVKVIEYRTTTPPEYNDAIFACRRYQILRMRIKSPHFQRDAKPPWHDTATSDLF